MESLGFDQRYTGIDMHRMLGLVHLLLRKISESKSMINLYTIIIQMCATPTITMHMYILGTQYYRPH